MKKFRYIAKIWNNCKNLLIKYTQFEKLTTSKNLKKLRTLNHNSKKINTKKTKSSKNLKKLTKFTEFQTKIDYLLVLQKFINLENIKKCKNKICKTIFTNLLIREMCRDIFWKTVEKLTCKNVQNR